MLPIAITQNCPVATREWSDLARDLLAKVDEIVTIENDDTYKAAGGLLADITKHSNRLDKDRLAACKPVNDLLKKVKAEVDAAREPLEIAKADLAATMTAYSQEQARIAAEQAKARAEEEAEEARLAAELLGPEAPAFVADLPSFPAETLRAPGTMQVDRLAIGDLLDISLVPCRFLTLDEKEINTFLRDNRDAILKALKDNPTAEIIPGVEILVKTTTQSTGRF